ncbi:coiled-coil domain-containing protein 191-like [Sinocyclocheilus grahami]|uniref:coiled-coil domain-containing protein 191-like n=1 Tax=Sinocyclocheilus grahami TaxID=75366 RepID=UPI0007ACA640|nr:PREDICTED: coiled-coil domain-containing protein 191-like [Sinocyclocheilus grahami]
MHAHVQATMANPIHRPDIFRWKTTKTKTPGSIKVQLNENDIKQWVKRVEKASEFAVAEVFSIKKPCGRKKSMALQNVEQLQDHNDAYSEAQSILSEWMNQKLRLELEMDDDEEEEEKEESKQLVKTTQSSYNNFDDMYFHLAQEEENSVVHNFLQDLMETEVLDFGIVEDLKVDSDQNKKKWRDPSITMEVRHKQVKENRMRRDAEHEKLHKEKEVLREVREEAWQLEKEKQRKKRQEAHRQEELIHQEMIRLRREMEEKRSVEQLARNMYNNHKSIWILPKGHFPQLFYPTKSASGENTSSHTIQKASLHRAALPQPTVQAMEERAQQRAERRREIEERRRQKQEEKLAQMKSAEEERLRAEEEEKQGEVERKKEEKRQQRKRELEKQKRAEREQELSKRAAQHYLRTLLLHRGLAPWKHLLEQSHVNTQKAVDHYTLALQRRCFCSWLQSVDEAHAEREASANQLYHRILLQRVVCSWKRIVEKEMRAVKKCFAGWRRLPVVLREEKEREARREQLRRKVAEILPDFRSSPIDSPWHSVNPL